MSYRKLEIIHQNPSSFFITDTTFPLDFTHPCFPSIIDSSHPFEFDPFFSGLDLALHKRVTREEIAIVPFYQKRVVERVARRVDSAESYLKAIADRVESLESRFDRLLAAKEKEKKLKEADRKYKLTAEIKGAEHKKYTWTAEIEGEKKGKRGETKYTWQTEIKGRNGGDDERTYTWKATIGGDKEEKKKKEKKEKKSETKKGASVARVVEIEEPLVVDDHRSLLLRQAFAKRAGHNKGKKKELSPFDAVVLIQRTFRAYLIRRSQALRALRELAIAKTKLKELRALFHNFSFRSRVSRDAEERQKFSEKIIVLLLTVDAIQGVDMMVRAAKRSMVDELEAMLDVVDPQQPGRSLSMRRRTFDMPSGTIQKEIAEGVAQVVQMLDEENANFEA